MSVEELCERIWDGGYTSLTELNYDLNELRQAEYSDGFTAGYNKAADDLKKLAKELEPF